MSVALKDLLHIQTGNGLTIKVQNAPGFAMPYRVLIVRNDHSVLLADAFSADQARQLAMEVMDAVARAEKAPRRPK